VVIDNTPVPKELPLQPGVLALTVSEAMHPAPLQISGALSLLEAGAKLVSDRCRSALIMNDEQQVLGILTLQDFQRFLIKAKTDAAAANALHQSVLNVCTTEVLHVYADELVSEAIARMSARGLQQLPVVTREQPHKLLGLLDVEDIALAQTIAKVRESLPMIAEAGEKMAIGI
jgi:CBS domain-containing protein